MTATGTTTPTSTDLVMSPAVAENVRKLLRSGKYDLIDIAQAVKMAPAMENVEGTVPEPMTISDKELDALKRLPDVFGKVNPTKPRLLNKPDKQAIDEERELIVTLEALVSKRKESLRHIINNHLDRRAEEKGLTVDQDKDKHGHWLVKNSDLIEDTNREMARSVATYKPTYDSIALGRAHQQGLISREDYLALTVKPEVDRVINVERAAKAIAKDPRLLAVLSDHGTAPGRKQGSVTIKDRAKG